MAIQVGIDGIDSTKRTSNIGIHFRCVEYEPVMIILWRWKRKEVKIQVIGIQEWKNIKIR